MQAVPQKFDRNEKLDAELERRNDLKNVENDWIYVPSIDPAPTTWASIFSRYLLDHKTDTIEIEILQPSMSVVRLMEPQKNEHHEIDHVVRVWLNKQQWLSTAFLLEHKQALQVLYERQYVECPTVKTIKKWAIILQLQLLQMALKSTLQTMELHHHSINSRVYKTKLGITADKKKIAKNAVHTENKRLALDFARNLVQTEEEKNAIANDHLADCVNQLYYHVKYGNEVAFEKEFKTSVKIVKSF